MENFIVPVLSCLTCVVSGYFLGVINTKRHFAKMILDDPDRIIGIINQTKSIRDDNSPLLHGIKIYVEEHNDQFYVYNKSTNLFLGQGPSFDDAIETVARRFPNQQFFYEEID